MFLTKAFVYIPHNALIAKLRVSRSDPVLGWFFLNFRQMAQGFPNSVKGVGDEKFY